LGPLAGPDDLQVRALLLLLSVTGRRRARPLSRCSQPHALRLACSSTHMCHTQPPHCPPHAGGRRTPDATCQISWLLGCVMLTTGLDEMARSCRARYVHVDSRSVRGQCSRCMLHCRQAEPAWRPPGASWILLSHRPAHNSRGPPRIHPPARRRPAQVGVVLQEDGTDVLHLTLTAPKWAHPLPHHQDNWCAAAELLAPSCCHQARRHAVRCQQLVSWCTQVVAHIGCLEAGVTPKTQTCSTGGATSWTIIWSSPSRA
jgi:hypothetical protein